GWSADGTNASISAAADVDIVAGSSRYDFRTWSDASTVTTLTAVMNFPYTTLFPSNYTKQYKLTLATAPAAVGTGNLSGLAAGGWYDDGTNASISAAADVDIVAGSSRYDFRTWSDASTVTTLTAVVKMDRSEERRVGKRGKS